MLPRYRVQVRKEIHTREGGSPEQYVFRDLELPFVPLPGLEIQDFDGELFRLGPHVTWREGQHRFVAYAEPHEEGPGTGEAVAPERPLEEILSGYEGRGWTRNRRAVERVAA